MDFVEIILRSSRTYGVPKNLRGQGKTINRMSGSAFQPQAEGLWRRSLTDMEPYMALS